MDKLGRQKFNKRNFITTPTPPLVKFFDSDAEDEDYAGNGNELIGLLEIDNGIEANLKKVQNSNGHEEKKATKYQACSSTRPDLQAEKTDSNSSSLGCKPTTTSTTTVITMESVHREWVERQICRAILNNRNKENNSQHRTKPATTTMDDQHQQRDDYDKIQSLFWARDRQPAEISLPDSSIASSSSTSMTASTDNTPPANSSELSTLSSQQLYEMDLLRRELLQSQMANAYLLDQNAVLYHSQAVIIHQLNMKQMETNALTMALVHSTNPHRLHQNHLVGPVHPILAPHPPAPHIVTPLPPPPGMIHPGQSITFMSMREHEMETQDGHGHHHRSNNPNQPKQMTPLNPKARPFLARNCWNSCDCHSELVISADGLMVHKRADIFINDFATVRSKYTIQQQIGSSGLFYYEVKVVLRLNRIWIGLSTRDLKLSNSLGYRQGWGFSNFGCFFECGRAKAYGEEYDTDDVIGCGVDMARGGELFFTKNGVYLGIAAKIPRNADVFPTASICSEGSIIVANFGQSSFLYMIDEK